jgi:(1->4)-alpha-D-glucan 1-alpha-D-glucosylmutase
LDAALVKAAREAQLDTSWFHPNPAAEEELRRFASTFFSDEVTPFHRLREKVAFFGALNALSQTLVRMTAPGVPDLYQGNELWNFSLVDPDNRRPVDFAQVERRLRALDRGEVSFASLRARWADGNIKMWVTSRGLRFRREFREVFATGGYRPIEVEGRHASSLVAFARQHGDFVVVVLAPRLCTRVVQEGQFPIGAVWEDTAVRLPEDFPARWERALEPGEVAGTGRLELREALRELPVGLLVGRS